MIKITAIVLSISFYLCFLASCSEPERQSPEQQIRDTLDNIEQAAEQRSMSDFMQYIADDYSDHQGNDQKNIRRILQLQFLRNQNINIFTRIHSIDVTGDMAAVELSAAMAAKGVDLSSERNRIKADAHRFSLAMAKHADTPYWRVQSVSWQRGW